MESKSEDQNKEKASHIQAAEAASERNLSLLKVSFQDLSLAVLSEFHNCGMYNVFYTRNT